MAQAHLVTPLPLEVPDSNSICSSMISVLEERDERETRRPRYLETLRHTIQANLIDENTPIEEFVHHIWGTPHDMVEAILEEDDWRLDKKMLVRYQDAFATRDSGRELTPRPHIPFRLLCAGLLNDVYRYFGLDPRDIEDEFVDGKGKQYADGDGVGFAERDPDFVRVWKKTKGNGRGVGEGDGPVEWESVKAFVELSTLRTTDGYSIRRPTAPLAEAYITPQKLYDWNGSIEVSSESDTSYRPTGHKRRCLSNAMEDENSDPNQNQNQHHNHWHRLSKRPRLSTTLTPDQLRFATYAAECLGTLYADRQYVTGIFVDVCRVSLWYFDRHLVLRTVSFDFSNPRGIKYLALTLFALARCDMRHAGFDPLLEGLQYPCPERTHSGRAKEMCLEPLPCPYFNPDEYCITFPKSPYELSCSSSKPTRFWVVEDWIDRFGGIIGHGTATLLVRQGFQFAGGKVRAPGTITIFDERQVLRYVWHPEGRKHEEDILEHLRKQMQKSRWASGWERHLPSQATWAGVYGAEELGLPWTRMALGLNSFYHSGMDRGLVKRKELHVGVGRVYNHLWEVSSVEQFKAVFLDCVQCHYHAYNAGGVLHGAISEKSMKVWYPFPNSDDDQRHRPLGMLTNWDIGPHPREENEIPHMRPHEEVRDGEGPFCFLAAELAHAVEIDLNFLGDGTPYSRPKSRTPRPRAYYRHDLESFFYILLWACIHYDFEFGGGHRDLVPPQGGLSRWLYNDTACEEKTHIMIDEHKWAMVEDMVKSGMREVFDEWVRPLREMFKAGFEVMPQDQNQERLMKDWESCKGLVTFEKFMKAIGETPRRPRAHSVSV